jgi:hypothetical protein
MVQLRVNNGTELIDLDLYDTDPIKLSIAIEDIESSQPISTFSKSFRLPATRKNNIFFRNVFYVDGRDYDVTIKNPASILFNGGLLKEGHIRLNKVYHNRKEDKIEYEITFLGELRDFVSILGDKPMCQLEIPDLEHGYNYENITLSWEAEYDDPTKGLLNGDVIYPLIDFGNTYNSSTGNVEQSRIATTAVDSSIFTNTPGLQVNRFKPMIKVKRVLDKIFEDTNFTYESDFINSYPFNNFYIATHGSDAQVDFDPNQYGIGSFIVSLGNIKNGFFLQQEPLIGPTTYIIPFDTIIRAIPSNIFDISISSYIAPEDGDFNFSGGVDFDLLVASSNEFETNTITFKFLLTVNGVVGYEGPEEPYTVVISQEPSTSIQTSFFMDNISLTLQTGDEVRLCFQLETDMGIFQNYVTSAFFETGSGNLQISPSFALDCEYKQIDFIKDLITMFKLVMAPVPNKERHFRIEPWTEYIGTGKVWDWSPKVNGNKDFIIEPLFDTQSRTLELMHKEGNDYINKYHKDAYSYTYGRRKIEVNNELLTGKKEIKTNNAPLIIAPVDGEPFVSNFIIPKIVVYKGEGEKLEKNPIKSEARFYFYNGLRSTGGVTWYFDSNTHTTYPLASPYSALDTLVDPTSEIYLNWNQDINYFNIASIQNNIDILTNRNLYQVFWKRYVDNLYNKWSRRVEVEMVLSPVDIEQLEFSDIIFIDGVYYYIDKITDMPITNNYNPVKVSLIKFNDFTLSEYKPPINCIWNENTQKWELQPINWDCEPIEPTTPTPTPTPPPTPPPTPKTILTLKKAVRLSDYIRKPI